MVQQLRVRIRSGQHPVLHQKFDVGDAARVLLDVELPRAGLGQFAPHAQPHLSHIGAQGAAMHGLAQHAAPHRLEAPAEIGIAGGRPRAQQGLMLPVQASWRW